MFVGTLPGLTATMGTALLVPFTFALPTGEGIAMLGGLYVCAMFMKCLSIVGSLILGGAFNEITPTPPTLSRSTDILTSLVLTTINTYDFPNDPARCKD